MKLAKPQNATKAHIQPKPLSIEQHNAIDLLIIGKTDQETADTVGVAEKRSGAGATSTPFL